MPSTTEDSRPYFSEDVPVLTSAACTLVEAEEAFPDEGPDDDEGEADADADDTTEEEEEDAELPVVAAIKDSFSIDFLVP